MAPMKNSSFMVLLKAAAPVSTSLVLTEAIVGKTVSVGVLLLSLSLSSSLITIVIYIFIVMVIIIIIIHFMGDLVNTFKDRVFEKDAGMIKIGARICNYEDWCFDQPTAFL